MTTIRRLRKYVDEDYVGTWNPLTSPSVKQFCGWESTLETGVHVWRYALLYWCMPEKKKNLEYPRTPSFRFLHIGSRLQALSDPYCQSTCLSVCAGNFDAKYLEKLSNYPWVHDQTGRIYGSLHRSPTSHLDKDCGLLYPAIYLLLLSDCLPATVGRRAFLVAGSRPWNDLPVSVTSAPSLLTFRKRLKLHLIRLSNPGLVL